MTGILALGLCLGALAAVSTGASATSLLSSGATPVLSVHGESVQWETVGPEAVYSIAISNAPRGAAGRTTQYIEQLGSSALIQSYYPTLAPGQTVYVGVSADGGLTWSAEEVAISRAITTPLLSVHNETVEWAALGQETDYEVALSNAPRGAAGRTTRYVEVPRHTGQAQSYTPSLTAGATVYVGVSADGGLTWSEEVTVTGESTIGAPTGPQSTPKEVGGTGENSVTPIVPKVPVIGKTPVVEEESVTPEEPTVTPPAQHPTPVLSVSGDTLSWVAIPGVTSYTLATILDPTTTRQTTYRTVTGTSYTPPTVPGQTVNYGLSATVPGEAPWAKEVTISYPPAAGESPAGGSGAGGESGGGSSGSGNGGHPEESPAETVTGTGSGSSSGGSGGGSTAKTGKIIGTNDGAGWGEAAAKTILGGHITWTRVEIGSQSNTLAQSLNDGFKVLAIVGNTADGALLSQTEPNRWGAEVVSQLQANPGIAIAEAGNEMYLKGGVDNPVQYGKMYMAAIDAMKAAGIHTPLLFNMWGDYSTSAGFSGDAVGGGWLREAIDAVPGLAAAILANGVSTHPYGALGENDYDDTGVNAVAAQEAVARTVLGSVPSFYITEFGYDLGKCGAFDGACSEQDQANQMRAAYEVFLSDAHVQGIWWYQSHDDSTGDWGYMNNNGTTRPAFNVLSSIAEGQGQ